MCAMAGSELGRSQEPATPSRLPMCVAGTPAPASPSIASSGALTRSWIGIRVAGTQTGAQYGMGHKQCLHVLCHSASPIKTFGSLFSALPTFLEAHLFPVCVSTSWPLFLF